MRRWLLEILACPICKTHPLECRITKEEDNDIIEGKLICGECGTIFNIKESIPHMLKNDLVKDEIELDVLRKHTKAR